MQSRYYNPKTGRFLNADSLVSTGQGFVGNNMFAYCYNNPVCMADWQGEDAIYVATTGEDGLPAVGHAILFVQDAKGDWHKTHFTGKKKRNAKVYTQAISEKKMRQYLSSTGINSIYISGDFADSYELAMQYRGTNYGGYNLCTNNCLHYVKELLRAGSPDNPWFDFWFNGSQISPMRFYQSLRSCRYVRYGSRKGSPIRGTIYTKGIRWEKYVY